MALVRWHGTEFTAEPIRQFDNGDWLMVAKQHGPRFSVGSEIRVKQSEIVEMASAETPMTEAESLAKLEASMAEERKLLPSPQELIANAPKTVARA